MYVWWWCVLCIQMFVCVCVWYHVCSAHVCNVRYRCSLSGNDSMLLAALLQLSSYTHGCITATVLIYTWKHYCNFPHIHMAALLQLPSYTHGSITASAFTYSSSSLSSISMAGSAGWVGSPTPRCSFMHVHLLTAAT